MRLTYNSDSIEHHGVKGQRWGVRRYQPYPKGSKKKGKVIGKAAKKEKAMSEDAKLARELKKKNRDELSNQELRKLNERTMLENQYKQLNPNAVKKGLAVAGTVAAAMGTVVALYRNGDQVIKIGKKVAGTITNKVGDMVVSDLNNHL